MPAGGGLRITRRSLVVALSAVGGVVPSASHGDTGGVSRDKLKLANLRWTGTKPTFPLFRAVAAGAFEGDVEVRVATRSDPMRYRPSLAFYRLAAALGSRLVPRTETHAVVLPDLLAALRKDPTGLALLRDDLAVLNDGTVMVLVSEAIAGGRDVDFVNGGEARAWRALAEAAQPVSRDRRELVVGYIETLVLDYLAANTRRSLVTVGSSAAAASIHLLDNGGAFAPRPDVAVLDAVLLQLKRVNRFPKRLIDAVRAFDRPTAERAFDGDSFLQWLVPSRPLLEMLERRGALLSLIDARVAEVGEPAVLASP